MTTLLLIRHCSTNLSSSRRYCGFEDPALNGIGLHQASCIAKKLKNASIEKIYTSDSKRARMTAEIIADRRPIEAVADFREMDFGIFDGLEYGELMKRYQNVYTKWVDNPWDIQAPEGESLNNLQKRVEPALSSIIALHDNATIALVSHGGPMRLILCKIMRKDMKTFRDITLDLGSITAIEFRKDAPAVITDLNNTSHLEDLEH